MIRKLNMNNMRDGIMGIGLQKLIEDLPSDLIMAEIGCFKGESTQMFLDSGKVKKLFAIDTWRTPRFVKAEQFFNNRFKSRIGTDLVKLKMTMGSAIEYLPKLDLIYIDGDHTYEWVKSDIIYSLKMIKPNGIIAGHDYVNRGNVGVIPAVNEMLGQPDKIYEDSSWIKYIK